MSLYCSCHCYRDTHGHCHRYRYRHCHSHSQAQSVWMPLKCIVFHGSVAVLSKGSYHFLSAGARAAHDPGRTHFQGHHHRGGWETKVLKRTSGCDATRLLLKAQRHRRVKAWAHVGYTSSGIALLCLGHTMCVHGRDPTGPSFILHVSMWKRLGCGRAKGDGAMCK